MGIKKQEFYEGAALHILARAGRLNSVRYVSPFFILNEIAPVMIKYSTRVRSPWGFTFTPDEQRALRDKASPPTIALVCGNDGVVAFSYRQFGELTSTRDSAIHVACYRQHGEHYEVSGPNGVLNKKVAPASWSRILNREE